MQRHTIVLNNFFSTGSTSPEVASGSSLVNFNGYEVNVENGLGGGVTNENNVRGFLLETRNQNLRIDFFNYLTTVTTGVEFSEIYNSDQKLSRVFNNYYNQSVLNNQIPDNSAIDSSLTGTTGITVVDTSNYNYNGESPSKGLDYIPLSIDNSTRLYKSYSALTTFTYDQSYYIPVSINRRSNVFNTESFYIEESFQGLINSINTEENDSTEVIITDISDFLSGGGFDHTDFDDNILDDGFRLPEADFADPEKDEQLSNLLNNILNGIR